MTPAELRAFVLWARSMSGARKRRRRLALRVVGCALVLVSLALAWLVWRGAVST